MLKLFWYCFKMSSDDEKFVTQRLHELSQFLEKPPAKIQLEIMPLPPELKYRATEILNAPPQRHEDIPNDSPYAPFSVSYCLHFRNLLKNYNSTRVLIYCESGSNIAKAAKEECHNAAWGLCSDPPLIAAVYKLNDEYILWHEALHLFGAEDCNKGHENPGPTCKLPGCIMQWIPAEIKVCSWPFLCQENVKLIRAWSKKHKLNDSTGRN